MDVHAKRWWLAAAATLALLGLIVLGLVRRSALQALRQSAREISSEQNLRFTVRQVPETSASPFEWITTPAVYSQAAEFQDHLFLCGPAGLYEYDPSGHLVRQFLVGKQLPPSPLTRMAVGTLADSDGPELLIATAGEGVLAFNGTRLRQILPEDPAARQITALLPLASGQLLLGTSSKGVLVYDGKHLRPFHPTLADVHVTALAGNEADLWVGTLKSGVLHWHGGRTDAISENDGLPDPQVLSLLVSGESAYVGTPLGVAEFRQGHFDRVIGQGAFAQSLGLSRRSLFIGTLDQGAIALPLSASPFPAGLDHRSWQLGDVEQIFPVSESVYALTRRGLYPLNADGGSSGNLIHSTGAVLTDGNISALSVAPDGRLWVGYFTRGLDIVGPDSRQTRHVEDDRVYCVNRILPTGSGGSVAVATANGLILFDAEGNERQVLTRADGLIASYVTDLVLHSGRMIVATPAGITFLDPGGARSLYAFEGLVNNHVYALADSGDRLLAGTLGGLSVLVGEHVVSSYTTANSQLNRNWISAVVPLKDGWMVGTYGGGIVRLDDSGRFHYYDVATGNFDVNPGAMLATESHIFAGSLGNGLYVFDRETGRWSQITAGLPSESVTALAAANGYVYIGTDDGLVRIREKDLAP